MGCTRRVDLSSVTPCGLGLSTYDDFRYGPDAMCVYFGYSSSTGSFSCVEQTCEAYDEYSTCIDYAPDVCYSHNSGWGTFTSCAYGQGWCTGCSYVAWVDCVIP
jgi:hypothetical protein